VLVAEGLWRKVAWTSCFGDGGGWDGMEGERNVEFGVWRGDMGGGFVMGGMIEIYGLKRG
jgi:hypothetical protein